MNGEAHKGEPNLRVIELPRAPHLCRTCGTIITAGHRFCATCKVTVTTQELIRAAEKGRLLSHTPEADGKRAENRRRHAAAQKAWLSSDQPAWLDEEAYRRKILPRLASVTVPALRLAIGISKAYATDIRSGRRLPHPRHWQTLAKLAEIIPDY